MTQQPLGREAAADLLGMLERLSADGYLDRLDDETLARLLELARQAQADAEARAGEYGEPAR